MKKISNQAFREILATGVWFVTLFAVCEFFQYAV